MVQRRIKRTSWLNAAKFPKATVTLMRKPCGKRGKMYGLSRETSAVCKDSNNECRGVCRGRSSRPRAGHGEGPNSQLP